MPNMEYVHLGHDILPSIYGICNERVFEDVTIAFDDNETIQAHKVFLTSSSLFFKELLQGKPEANLIHLVNGFTKDIFMLIKNFIYFGTTKLNHDQLELFFEMAISLQIEGLRSSSIEVERNKVSKEEIPNEDNDELKNNEESRLQVSNTVTTKINKKKDRVNEKKYKCDFCDYVSLQSCNLKSHIMTNHDERVF